MAKYKKYRCHHGHPRKQYTSVDTAGRNYCSECYRLKREAAAVPRRVDSCFFVDHVCYVVCTGFVFCLSCQIILSSDNSRSREEPVTWVLSNFQGRERLRMLTKLQKLGLAPRTFQEFSRQAKRRFFLDRLAARREGERNKIRAYYHNVRSDQ